jgi:hypothetical protein
LTSSAEPSLQVTLQARLVVVQEGARLTITGSVTFLGETAELPAITGTIDENGVFTADSGDFAATAIDSECRVTGTSSTLTLSGDTVKLDETVTSEFCGTFTMSGELTRAG